MAVNSQNTILPAPPRYVPGMAVDDYNNQLNRWLTNLYEYLTGITYIRGNGLFLPLKGVPTSATGLKIGEVWSNSGILTRVES